MFQLDSSVLWKCRRGGMVCRRVGMVCSRDGHEEVHLLPDVNGEFFMAMLLQGIVCGK